MKYIYIYVCESKNDKLTFEGNKNKLVCRTVLTYKSGPPFQKCLGNAYLRCLRYCCILGLHEHYLIRVRYFYISEVA